MEEVSNFCPPIAVPITVKNARADDRADAKRGQRPRPERFL